MKEFRLPITLGRNVVTGETVSFAEELLRLHGHFIGATGSGKTSALVLVIIQILINFLARPGASMFILDPLGGLANQLLHWLASPSCPEAIRRRLVYWKPSDETYVTTMNSFDASQRSEAYRSYIVARLIELLMRGFENQDPSATPRMRLWLHRAIYGLTLLGLPLACAKWLLQPRTPEGKAMLARLPVDEQIEWHEIFGSGRGDQALRLLESARNRISMIKDHPILQRFHSSNTSLFQVRPFIDTGRIVLIDLSPGMQRLNYHAAGTLGSMILNELFNQVMVRFAETKKAADCYLFVDEMHRFLGPDIYEFLPIVRNAGLRLAGLSHQSFTQLQEGDIDLRPLIGQARNKFWLGSEDLDADLLAEEVANLVWDPDEVKREWGTWRQRVVEHEKVVLKSGGNTTMQGDSQSQVRGKAEGTRRVLDPTSPLAITETSNTSGTFGTSGSYSTADNWSENLKPVYEDFYEVTRNEYVTREEVVHKWRGRFRGMKAGDCLHKPAEQAVLHPLKFDLWEPSGSARAERAVEELIQQNYEEGPFMTAVAADAELERLRQQILQPPKLVIPGTANTDSSPQTDAGENDPLD